MGFTEAVKSGFQNYANISGRAPRSAYWWWILFILIVSLVLTIIDVNFLGTDPAYSTGPLSMIFGLATLVPGVCLAVRRLHDHDKSGWWVLVVLIPLLGAVYLLYLFILRGTVGENQYGPDPLEGI